MFFTASQARAHATCVALSRQAAAASPEPETFALGLGAIARLIQRAAEAAMAEGKMSVTVESLDLDAQPEVKAVVIQSLEVLGYDASYEEDVLTVEW